MSHRRKIENLGRQRGADGLLELARESTSEDETLALVLEQLAALADAGGLDESQRVEASSIARASVLAADKYVRSWSLALMFATHDELVGLAPEADAIVCLLPEPLVRTTVAVALANKDVVGRAEALMGLLDDPEGPVRQMAAAALVEIGDVGALPRLRDRVEREGDDHARAAMRRAIVSLEERPGS